ncbi:MAG: hypothetical protein CMJ59_24045 [Planctomycetaceae bacterium]|nr:hypothetical protein [Planctomycetaceae bacterium]
MKSVTRSPAQNGLQPLLMPLLLLMSFPVVGYGAAPAAVKRVADGIRHFQAGRFAEADRAFAEAEVSEPENATIWFDRACALTAAGELEKARKLFQQAALSRNAPLEVRCHYNLGCLAAGQAQGLLGQDPAVAEESVRQQCLALLMQAVGHYRDCLRLDPGHRDARHNLELIRIYIKHIQSLWEARDREQARAEKGLLPFLAELEQRQTSLWSTARRLEAQADSPRRRQTVRATAIDQRKLREEIDPLKQKVDQFFESAPGATPGATSSLQDQDRPDPTAQAKQLLKQLASEANQAMNRSALALESDEFSSAQQHQRQTLDRFNQMFMVAAPFTGLLQRATQQQQNLVEASAALTAQPDGQQKPDADPPPPDPATAALPGPPSGDPVGLSYQQARVSEWSRMLTLKAQSELEGATAETPPADPPPPGAAPPAGAEASAEQQRAALREALQKAVELGPDVERHARDAATQLEAAATAEALPDQRRALELLQEIAKSLSQPQDPQQQPESGQGKNDQQQQKPQPEDSSSPPQDAADSRQQKALATLRRARERERQHRDLQKQLRRAVGRRVPVERDW